MNFCKDARVKLRSLLLTALIRVPSTASSSRPNGSICVNRRPILTPHRRSKLTPLVCSVLSVVPVVHRFSARAASVRSETDAAACALNLWTTGARGLGRSGRQDVDGRAPFRYGVSRDRSLWEVRRLAVPRGRDRKWRAKHPPSRYPGDYRAEPRATPHSGPEAPAIRQWPHASVVPGCVDRP